jgi:hypothetical protein
MQTLGRHGGAQEGVFRYKRGSAGVTLDPSISRAVADPHANGAKPAVVVSTAEWTKILAAIEQTPANTFRITTPGSNASPQPAQSLHDLIRSTVPHPAGGWNWDGSYLSYVCAVLEHEGVLDLYHGLLGNGNPPAVIALVRDIP